MKGEDCILKQQHPSLALYMAHLLQKRGSITKKEITMSSQSTQQAIAQWHEMLVNRDMSILRKLLAD